MSAAAIESIHGHQEERIIFHVKWTICRSYTICAKKPPKVKRPNWVYVTVFVPYSSTLWASYPIARIRISWLPHTQSGLLLYSSRPSLWHTSCQSILPCSLVTCFVNHKLSLKGLCKDTTKAMLADLHEWSRNLTFPTPKCQSGFSRHRTAVWQTHITSSWLARTLNSCCRAPPVPLNKLGSVTLVVYCSLQTLEYVRELG